MEAFVLLYTTNLAGRALSGMMERMDGVHIIILAGGKGKRLNSEHEGPKVLRKIGGVPIILRILEHIRPVCSEPTMIVGFEGQKVIDATGDRYRYVWQADQLGTGHAALQAKPYLMNEGFSDVLIVPGDHPFLSAKTLERLIGIRRKDNAAVAMATAEPHDFTGMNSTLKSYGRIVRSAKGDVLRIVEVKDADEKILKIREVNCGIYCFRPDWLWANLERIGNDNAAKEFYLTDVVGLAVSQGERVHAMVMQDTEDGYGVNTPEEFHMAEEHAKASARKARD